MLFVVVLLTLVSIVVPSMFLLTLMLLVPTWPMALLYHLYKYTHYTYRGGASDHIASCGAFYISVRYAFYVAGWDIGAAL